MDVTRADVARDYWDDWGLLLLWTSFFLGPLAVSLDLGAGYALVKPLCGNGHPELLRAVSFAALIVAVAGVILAWRCMQNLPRTVADDGGRVVDRSYFTALVAVGLDVTCVMLILTAAGARLVMPCE